MILVPVTFMFIGFLGLFVRRSLLGILLSGHILALGAAGIFVFSGTGNGTDAEVVGCLLLILSFAQAVIGIVLSSLQLQINGESELE